MLIENTRVTCIVRTHIPDGMAVAEVESWYDLTEEPPRFLRSEPAFLHQVVKQLTATHMLQYQISAPHNGTWYNQGLVRAHSLQVTRGQGVRAEDSGLQGQGQNHWSQKFLKPRPKPQM